MFCARSFNGNTALNVTEIGDSNEEKGNIKKDFYIKRNFFHYILGSWKMSSLTYFDSRIMRLGIS